MSRFKKLSQTIWYCQYHIVWVPKFRVLTGKVGREVEKCIRIFSEQQGCEVEELNVQIDHVHLLALIPPKISISIRKYIRYQEERERNSETSKY